MLLIAGIIILGIFAQWLAWRVRIPAILPLIIIGICVGPLSELFTEDGHKLLEPIYNEDLHIGLFPNEYLFHFVSLAIGIILFEGGLSLKRKEIQGVAPVIGKLISFGSLITFIGGGLGAHFIMGLTWPVAFLFSALIIVTGPTVIAPILQNVPLNKNVATVLKWEGILIDPIGALAAVLVFEFIQSADGGLEFTSHAFIQFINIILIGLSLGALSGYALYWFIKREWIPHYLLNVFTLAFVLGVFVFSDIMAHESGLLSVVVMGTVLGNLDVPQLKEILSFKESLSVLLISILFILLAANIDLEELYLIINDWRSFALFAFVIVILRPLGVFISTRKSELSYNEKAFISWVGPRGIVAAGIASLFGLTLKNANVEDAEYITPLVFMIVLGTVLLNATTARLTARWLKVIKKASDGILIVGGELASRIIAKYLSNNDRNVMLIDNNKSNVERSNALGIQAYVVDIYNDNLEENIELLDVGYLLAMTSSAEVNNFTISKYSKNFGENGTFRLITAEELKKDKKSLPNSGIFSYNDDFLNLNEVARDYPQIHEVEIMNDKDLDKYLSEMSLIKHRIPIFIKTNDGVIHPIPRDKTKILESDTSFILIYLGKKLEQATVSPDQSLPDPAVV
ncbi:MAG: cation:proton antiporter [Bacteroidota bacterium]